MRFAFIVFVLLIGITPISAQERSSAAESVDNIKMQLIEVTAKEEMAKLRVQQLDEALRPESIERALAGVGSTRPEDLREQRKRQLTLERTAAKAQTEQFALQRTRLESALVTAEANAYLISAQGTSAIENSSTVSISLRGLVVMGIVGLLVIALAVVLLVRTLRLRGDRAADTRS